MPEVESLILQVKSDSVEKGADRLDHLARASTKADNSQKSLTVANTATSASMGRTAATTGAAATATGGYAKTANVATASTVALGAALKATIAPLALILAPFLALKKAVAITGDLEHALSGVKAVTGATASEMRELEDVARSLGATTIFSAKEAADGMQFLGMAGFETNEIVEAMPGLLDLAAAGQLGLAEASDIASNVLSGFRLEVSESGRVADILALGAASANTSVLQLGNALSFAAPVAAALGRSIEETATAIGVLSDAGIQGQRAGTGLRTVFAALSSATPEVEKALRDLGLSLEDVSPEANDLESILQKLSAAGLGAKDAFKIFGREGAPAILALTSQVGRFGELKETLENAEGAAGEMAITLSDDLHGSYKKLGSVMSEFAIRLDEIIGASDLWKATIDGTTEAVQGLSKAMGSTVTTEDVSRIHELVGLFDELSSLSVGDQTVIGNRTLQQTKAAIEEFSQVEIALARAENQLVDLAAVAEVKMSEALSKRLLESPLEFRLRKQKQRMDDLAEHERGTSAEQRADTARKIEAKKEEVLILKELLAVQREMDSLPTATDAPTSGASQVVSLEFERLQRQLQTEEEAIQTSYQNRLEIIRENTEEASELRLDLETRAANERNSALLKIEKTAADEKKAIQIAQFQNFQQVTTLTAALTGQLADMAEEGSDTQKAMFLVGKGISIAQARINTELGATAALGLGPFGIPMATTIRMLGYASIGLMVGQTVDSFEQGGILGGGSFSGDKLTFNGNSGEMVLTGQQQSRLFSIANGANTGSGSKSDAMGINITVENYGSSEISVERLGENDVRIIARDTARQVVREDAPAVIASDLRNANSRTSRSLAQNTKTERKR